MHFRTSVVAVASFALCACSPPPEGDVVVDTQPNLALDASEPAWNPIANANGGDGGAMEDHAVDPVTPIEWIDAGVVPIDEVDASAGLDDAGVVDAGALLDAASVDSGAPTFADAAVEEAGANTCGAPSMPPGSDIVPPGNNVGDAVRFRASWACLTEDYVRKNGNLDCFDSVEAHGCRHWRESGSFEFMLTRLTEHSPSLSYKADPASFTTTNQAYCACGEPARSTSFAALSCKFVAAGTYCKGTTPVGFTSEFFANALGSFLWSTNYPNVITTYGTPFKYTFDKPLYWFSKGQSCTYYHLSPSTGAPTPTESPYLDPTYKLWNNDSAVGSCTMRYTKVVP